MILQSEKKYLITGGSGFLAEGLLKYLTNHNILNISILARNEGNLIKMKQKFPHVDIITGNCGDPKVMFKALDGVDGVFHLAAFKHVGLAEQYPLECIYSNITSSSTLLECSLHFDLDFIIGISTDKACQVSGVYGATKYLMEKMFLDFEQINKSNKKTKYRIVRYGNVLYSTGSVLCKWKELIQQGKQVVITDPSATRFYWTVEQAIDLIIKCLENATDATPFIPEMKSISLENLLTAMIKKYAPLNSEIPVKCIGLQNGENLHEQIQDNGLKSNQVEQYTIDEIMKLI
jgi:UDP-N-acetylglucosamine 4,6-dehydratase/UDP-glucose 4-epimerase